MTPGLIDTALGSVQPHECDVMGHMNVRHYVARSLQALAALALALGLGPRVLRERRLRLGVVDHHIRFQAELHPGAGFAIGGGLLAHDARGFTAYQEMRHTGGARAVAATFRTEAALFDATSGERVPLPVLAGAAALAVVLPDHARPKGLELAPPRPRPHWHEADTLRLPLAHAGQVAADECDADGWLREDGIIARIWDGVPNLPTRGVHAAAAGEARADRGGIGSAALEYRLHYHATPRAGDLLAVRSALRSVGSKTTVAGHWLFDRESELAVATAELVSITFDLATRKARELDAATRERLAGWVVPTFSA